MSDYRYLALAKMQMNERIEEARRSRLPDRRRSRRHSLAHGLHSLATRIEG